MEEQCEETYDRERAGAGVIHFRWEYGQGYLKHGIKGSIRTYRYVG